MSYEERLKHLNLYSIQRRRDRYKIIYLWKNIEKFVPNKPLCSNYMYSIACQCGTQDEKENCFELVYVCTLQRDVDILYLINLNRCKVNDNLFLIFTHHLLRYLILNCTH